MFDSTASAAAEESLTDRQREVLDVVRSYAAEHGYPPTVREIGTLLGLASSSTVHSHLAALERAGIVQRDPTKPRALKWGALSAAEFEQPVPGEYPGVDVEPARTVPVLGRVAAGEPLLAEQHIEQYLPVPKLLTRSGECFLLKVRGDSMIGAGILDGDYVVVRRQPTAVDGEIVVALVGDDADATCKRYVRRGGRVELHPENPHMEPIIPDACEIVGIVTGVMRSL